VLRGLIVCGVLGVIIDLLDWMTLLIS
jgi:hypothetical protein